MLNASFIILTAVSGTLNPALSSPIFSKVSRLSHLTQAEASYLTELKGVIISLFPETNDEFW